MSGIDGLAFEIELIRQPEINIDYTLMLVIRYHDNHRQGSEVLVTISKAMDTSPELRSRNESHREFYRPRQRRGGCGEQLECLLGEERELRQIIDYGNPKEFETRKFIGNTLRDGEVRATGIDIDGLMPPISHFGGGVRAQKKQICRAILNSVSCTTHTTR